MAAGFGFFVGLGLNAVNPPGKNLSVGYKDLDALRMTSSWIRLTPHAVKTTDAPRGEDD